MYEHQVSHLYTNVQYILQSFSKAQQLQMVQQRNIYNTDNTINPKCFFGISFSSLYLCMQHIDCRTL